MDCGLLPIPVIDYHACIYIVVLIPVEGENFTLGATVLVFPNGTMEGGMTCVDVTIIDDNVLEFDHSFEVSILLPSSSPGASLAAASPDNTEYTITDDEGVYT